MSLGGFGESKVVAECWTCKWREAVWCSDAPGESLVRECASARINGPHVHEAWRGYPLTEPHASDHRAQGHDVRPVQEESR